MKGEEDAIVSEPEVTQVFEGKDAFCTNAEASLYYWFR